jgi:hypothetical protein
MGRRVVREYGAQGRDLTTEGAVPDQVSSVRIGTDEVGSRFGRSDRGVMHRTRLAGTGASRRGRGAMRTSLPQTTATDNEILSGPVTSPQKFPGEIDGGVDAETLGASFRSERSQDTVSLSVATMSTMRDAISLASKPSREGFGSHFALWGET